MEHTNDALFPRDVHRTNRDRVDRMQAHVIARCAVSACALVVLGLGNAVAGYAQLSPPSGWSAGTGRGGMMSGSAANDALGGGWRAAQAGLNAGGKAIKVPAAYRFAANAGRFAARGYALNPWLLGAAGIAWLAEECIEYTGGEFKITCVGGGTPVPVPKEYYFSQWVQLGFFSSAVLACQAFGPYYSANVSAGHTTRLEANGVTCTVLNAQGSGVNEFNVTSRDKACPVGWTQVSGLCVPPQSQPRTITPQEVEEIMAPKPVPDLVPREIPGIPLPIELPKINPTPGSNPQPQPLWVPQGSPSPIPNTDPQQYTQPGIRVSPAPTPSSPWQVDLKPEDKVGTDPSGLLDPETVVDPNAPVAKPEQTDLCAANPSILACAELDTPDGPDVKEEKRGGPITPDTGWGGENASCPQPRILTVQGRQIPIPYDLFCMYMEGIRPLVISMAWLSASFILLGRKGGD